MSADCEINSVSTSVLVGALGSIIGYLGSEVAEKTLFERLMWPQRYYNHFNLTIFAKQGFFMTMGGPLHAAALETLDVLQNNGLYLGARRGDMLGTAFLQDLHIKNFHRTNDLASNTPKESRNGFWLQVLRNIKDAPDLAGATDLPKSDTESNDENVAPYRAMQLVHHLKLKLVADGEKPGPGVACVSEQHCTWKTFANILSSELSTVTVAIVAGTVMQCWWLVLYMCVPLILKFLSVLFSVRRQGLQSEAELNKEGSLKSIELFEVQDPNHGFVVIEGPAPVILQFFRHYGHPIRDRRTNIFGDRFREIFSMMLIYAFVLYFPAGLVANLWMSTNVQYLWLGYQLYAILVMHIVRILGWKRCSGTEEHVAALLSRKKEVWLQSATGSTVAATLVTKPFPRINDGKAAVQDIILSHRQSEHSPVSELSCRTASVSSESLNQGESAEPIAPAR